LNSGDLFTGSQDFFVTSSCSGIIYRLVSNGQGGFSSVPFVSALNGPDGLAVGQDGTLYVATNEGVVQVSRNSSGNFSSLTQVASMRGGANGLAAVSSSVGLKPYLYISTSGGTFYRIDLNNPSLQTIAEGLGSCEGVAADAVGNVYLATASSIYKVSSSDGTNLGGPVPTPTPEATPTQGTVTPSITPTALASLPESVNFDPTLSAWADLTLTSVAALQGAVYASSNCSSPTIFILSQNGVLTPFVTLPTANGVCGPIQLAASSGLGGFEQDLLFASMGNKVFVITSQGLVTPFIAQLPSAAAADEVYLAFDQIGTYGYNLLIADNANGNIWQVNAQGSVTQLSQLSEGIQAITVAPSTFAPYGGQLLVAGLSDNIIYTVDSSGNLAPAFTFPGLRGLAMAPPNFCVYQSTDLSLFAVAEGNIVEGFSNSLPEFNSEVQHLAC
jgi:hypothetical protein